MIWGCSTKTRCIVWIYWAARTCRRCDCLHLYCSSDGVGSSSNSDLISCAHFSRQPWHFLAWVSVEHGLVLHLWSSCCSALALVVQRYSNLPFLLEEFHQTRRRLNSVFRVGRVCSQRCRVIIWLSSVDGWCLLSVLLFQPFGVFLSFSFCSLVAFLLAMASKVFFLLLPICFFLSVLGFWSASSWTIDYRLPSWFCDWCFSTFDQCCFCLANPGSDSTPPQSLYSYLADAEGPSYRNFSNLYVWSLCPSSSSYLFSSSVPYTFTCSHHHLNFYCDAPIHLFQICNFFFWPLSVPFCHLDPIWTVRHNPAFSWPPLILLVLSFCFTLCHLLFFSESATQFCPNLGCQLRHQMNSMRCGSLNEIGSAHQVSWSSSNAFRASKLGFFIYLVDSMKS